jgi:hypothetical protein
MVRINTPPPYATTYRRIDQADRHESTATNRLFDVDREFTT